MTSNLLAQFDLQTINHYTPLHYLVYIARSKALLGKPSLKKAGFGPKHLRSKSSKQDVERGFGKYAFLTIDASPRILQAKLAAGFPHIAIGVPSSAIDKTAYSLCRFNVAMTRFLRRGNKPGFPESDGNGRYYSDHQIPIASTEEEKEALLTQHLNESTMIEVLIDGDLPLPADTTVTCFSGEDAEMAKKVLGDLSSAWIVQIKKPQGPYPRKDKHASSVADFIDRALADPTWRGNGLEFDRV